MYSDSHCHLDGFTDEQMDSVMSKAGVKGVEMVVSVGTHLDTSEATIKVARSFPGIVAAAGMHPWWVTSADLEAGSRLRKLLGQEKVAAVGEVGIDLEKNPSTADTQWGVLRLQLALAKELDLPLLLHCKGARREMQDVLRREGSLRGVLHGFGGDTADAESWLGLGLYIGIGIRTFTRDYSPEREKAIRSIPLEKMLLETDCSVRSYTGDENLQPTKVIEVAERVGRIHGVAPEEVGRRTTANLRAMLGK